MCVLVCVYLLCYYWRGHSQFIITAWWKHDRGSKSTSRLAAWLSEQSDLGRISARLFMSSLFQPHLLWAIGSDLFMEIETGNITELQTGLRQLVQNWTILEWRSLVSIWCPHMTECLLSDAFAGWAQIIWCLLCCFEHSCQSCSCDEGASDKTAIFLGMHDDIGTGKLGKIISVSEIIACKLSTDNTKPNWF